MVACMHIPRLRGTHGRHAVLLCCIFAVFVNARPLCVWVPVVYCISWVSVCVPTSGGGGTNPLRALKCLLTPHSNSSV